MADPESNRNLKVVLERAKTYRVPKNIIDRAIEKAKGGSEENYDELRYEGFGVSGTMVIIEAHQKIGLMEKISPIKLYTKVKKSIEKNTNIRYNLIDEN